MRSLIFTSTIDDGSMKSVHQADSRVVSVTRAAFLNKRTISPDDTTLVRLTYDGEDYRRYATLDDSDKGDGITRQSNIISDALVVTRPDHALFLPLADCIGAVLHDPTKNILMMSHLGRHNLEQFGGTACVDYLIHTHDVEPKNLTVWLSPAAGKASYPLFAFDHRSLHDVASEQLTKAGVPRENIDISSIDSAADLHYYSHSQFLKGNRESDGRFAIVAVMR